MMKTIKTITLIAFIWLLCSCDDNNYYNYPVLEAKDAINITYCAADIEFSISPHYAIVEYGIIIGADSVPDIYNGIRGISPYDAGSSCVLQLSGLLPETQYYYYPYAFDVDENYVVGETKSFTTTSCLPPSVTTLDIYDIKPSSASCEGKVTDSGGKDVLDRGFCWGTNSNPTISDYYISQGAGTGQYSCTIVGLNPNTDYYLRAYATNVEGTSYSEQKTFKTADNVYHGNVLLSTQYEVDYFIEQGYTEIEGDLVIGSKCEKNTEGAKYYNGSYYSINEYITSLGNLRIEKASGGIALINLKYVDDISFLKGYQSNYLAIEGLTLSDISVLSTLTNLDDLSLDSNHISDFSPLSYLTNLVSLSLSHNSIVDISFLSNLKKLQWLTLFYNSISDLSPLSSLTNLVYLDLWGNDIKDVSALSTLLMLKWLDIGDNEITSIDPISSLTNLTHLQLAGNNLSNISALSPLTQLTELLLYCNNITDISLLSSFTSLTTLYLGYSSRETNTINNLVPLYNLTNLTKLYLEYLPITQVQVAELQSKLPNCTIYSEGVNNASGENEDMGNKDDYNW